ncbi:MAG TPA: heme-binding protein [Tepidisphaeraceae bacterium]|nr:heme-binding protein [Tepidisphaeraceae bacterium]
MTPRLALSAAIVPALLSFVGACSAGLADPSAAAPPARAAAPAPTPAPALPATRPATQPAPFVFDEALLPKNFPPPGPVGEVIVKHYPAYRAARVAAKPGAAPGQDGMFMTLFRHIQSNDIPMTAPVEMTYDPAATADVKRPAAMAFLYQSTDVGAAGPAGDKVDVVDVPPAAVVSVGVRGSYRGAAFANGLAQLRAYLAAHPADLEPAGPPRYLGYNSPIVPPFAQYGEVQIPVRTPAR